MEYLRKVVRTNKEPDEKEVLWVDTAHPDYPVMKYYENGNWKLIRQREDGVAYIMPYGGIPYSDLSQEVKMAIASGGAQANWNQTNSASPDFIWNKPYIPTALADLTEDSNHKFVSAAEKTSWSNKAETSDIPDVSGKADRVQSAVAGHIATLDSFGNLVDSGKGISDINPLWGNIQGSIENQTDLMSALGDKYEKPSTGIPASDLASGVIPDVSNFITKSVDDLVNYYLKSETYTKAEVQALIGAIQSFHYEIYASTAAVTNPQGNVLYLIGPTGSGEDKYEEYVYDVTKQNPWVKIGSTDIDLSDYATLTDLATKADKVSSPTAGHLASLDSNGNLVDSGVAAEDVPDTTWIERLLGQYGVATSVTLEAGESGKYLDGYKKNNAAFSISKPMWLEENKVYLLKVSTMPGGSFTPVAVAEEHTAYPSSTPAVYEWDWESEDYVATATNTTTGNIFAFERTEYLAEDLYIVYKNGVSQGYVEPFYQSDINNGDWPVPGGPSYGKNIETIFPKYQYDISYKGREVTSLPEEGYYVFVCTENAPFFVSYEVSGGALYGLDYDLFRELLDKVYVKPRTGVPFTDLADDVQDSIRKADISVDYTKAQISSSASTYPYAPKEGDIWKKSEWNELTIPANTDVFTFENIASQYKLVISGNEDETLNFKWTRVDPRTNYVSRDYEDNGTYYFEPPYYDIVDNELTLESTGIVIADIASLYAEVSVRYEYHNGSWVAIEVVTATEKAAWNSKYDKPASGIPASDIASGVIPDVSGKADAATTLAGYGITDAYTKTEVDSKVSSAYKAAGTVASVASLGTLDAAHEGFVYNMSASFTTTSDFVEGSGTTYPAGTNVVIVDVGAAQSPSYKYDVLAGFVDISGKADKSEMSVVDGTDANADKTTITLKSGTSATVLKSHQDISGKADKVSGATNGHLAGLDSNGNLTDSGKSTSDFQPTIDSSHKLAASLVSGLANVATSGSFNDLSNKPDEVEANPTVPSGTTPTALTGLKIGNSYYSAPSVVALTNNEIDTIWTNAS